MANDKYAKSKCFILSADGYEEITYSELLRRRDIDESYKNKKFLPLHGMLMEVSPEEYQQYYKAKRRQKYLREQSEDNGDFSFDALTTDTFNGEDILVDESEPVDEQIIRKVMEDKLRKAMLLLSEDERLLIYLHYYAAIPETELAAFYGISQQAISKRIAKVRGKLKNIIEN